MLMKKQNAILKLFVLYSIYADLKDVLCWLKLLWRCADAISRAK